MPNNPNQGREMNAPSREDRNKTDRQGRDNAAGKDRDRKNQSQQQEQQGSRDNNQQR